MMTLAGYLHRHKKHRSIKQQKPLRSGIRAVIMFVMVIITFIVLKPFIPVGPDIEFTWVDAIAPSCISIVYAVWSSHMTDLFYEIFFAP